MVKKLIIALHIILFFSTIAFSQRLSREEYILKYQLLAIREMERSGIPASITMAQACLESADGNSELSRKSNNHFGIKCKAGWKGKKVYYDDDHHNECFRKYRHVEDSYIDHTSFLMGNYRYAFLFNYAPTDYKSWAKGLKKAGYATARDYDKKLIKIIETYKLNLLDEKIGGREIARFTQPRLAKDNAEGGFFINPYQTRKVELRNGIRSVVVRNGDTFETIAREFGLEDWEIYKFNDYHVGYKPQPNEIIYISPKKRRAQKHFPTHTVRQGESLHSISQMYGIRLHSLYRLNRIDPGQRIVVGQKLELRKRKKY
ncbi:Hemagglutinin [hydrothermal vent metagenome]|uniref:Peptidoglycan hydrolase n=1 Tax=hydrothermal vent metagenome TaxID=652676 RepID=A0A3B0TFG8_9ZZZZ